MKSGYLSELFASFQGEGAHAGRRHLFVRLAGCNLRCRYCDTPDSLERTRQFTVHRENAPADVRGNPVSAAAVRELIEELCHADGAIDAVAITGGEPLVQAEFLAEVLRPRLGWPVLLETNGMLPHRLRAVVDCIDIISMDVKLPSNSGEGAFWAEHAEFMRAASGVERYMKILIDDATSDGDVQRATELIRAHAPGVAVFLQPIMDEQNRPVLGARRLADMYALARRDIPTVRVLPQLHKLLGIR